MNVPGSMTTAVAEDLIQLLQNPAAVEQLLVPTKAKHQAAGGEASFVQALATWANTVDRAALKTWATGPEDVQIDRLTDRLYGLVATLVADRIATRAGVDVTEAFRRSAGARLDALQMDEPAAASRGPQIEVVCADHLARSHPLAFYEIDVDGVAAVKRLPQFNKFIQHVLLPTVVTRELARAMHPGTAAALGTALHELFRNTDEHGRGDQAGNTPRKSVRGVQAKRHAIAPEALIELTRSSPPLAEYCRRLAPARANNRDVQLIELNVFDSGPGLAASLSGIRTADMDFDREVQTTLRCFQASVSRKSSSSSGLGLPNMVQVLRRQRGFLRVRSGRTALYSDLSREGGAEFGRPPELRHWSADQPVAAPVTGTLFTLMFPLEL